MLPALLARLQTKARRARGPPTAPLVLLAALLCASLGVALFSGSGDAGRSAYATFVGASQEGPAEDGWGGEAAPPCHDDLGRPSECSEGVFSGCNPTCRAVPTAWLGLRP